MQPRRSQPSAIGYVFLIIFLSALLFGSSSQKTNECPSDISRDFYGEEMGNYFLSLPSNWSYSSWEDECQQPFSWTVLYISGEAVKMTATGSAVALGVESMDTVLVGDVDYDKRWLLPRPSICIGQEIVGLEISRMGSHWIYQKSGEIKLESGDVVFWVFALYRFDNGHTGFAFANTIGGELERGVLLDIVFKLLLKGEES